MSAAHRKRGGSGGRSAPGLMNRRNLVCVVIATLCLSFPAGARAQVTTGTLQLALVIPVHSAPLFSAAGTPVKDADARVRSLTGQLDRLRSPELEDLPFALSPSPVLCDELVQLGGAGQGLTDILLALSTRARPVANPYADVRLTDLPISTVGGELAEGQRRVAPCGQPDRTVLLPPDLELDDEALAAIEDAGVTVALAPLQRVPRGPTRPNDVTLVPTAAVGSDETPNDTFLHFQNVTRAVALIAPQRPDLVTFISSLANDPRIELVDIRDLVTDPISRPVAFPSSPSPPASYRRTIDAAEDALRRLRSFTTPGNRLVEILRTSAARARSSAEWNGNWSVGRSRARDLVGVVDGQQDLVSAADGSVTFTSQRGSVPVTVTNDTGYPVRVLVTLQSSKLEFPDGRSRVVVVDPPGDTVVFVALARSTGTFPVQVDVTTADGRIRFEGSELTVRSTAANLAGLVLTTGAALFLAGWYVRHRRRRHKERVTST